MTSATDRQAELLIDDEIYRYERKFVDPNLSLAEILLMVKTHPALFQEQYEPRRVNNIYLDSANQQCYHDHVLGKTSRFKSRIRWYGQKDQISRQPKLEIKIKDSSLGYKESIAVRKFDLDYTLTRDLDTILRGLRETSPLAARYITGLKPIVGNSYLRRYFRSADSKFRLTVDWDIAYTPIADGTPFFERTVRDSNIVLELKYAAGDDDDADRISRTLPYRLVRNSKYMNAIEMVFA